MARRSGPTQHVGALAHDVTEGAYLQAARALGTGGRHLILVTDPDPGPAAGDSALAGLWRSLETLEATVDEVARRRHPRHLHAV